MKLLKHISVAILLFSLNTMVIAQEKQLGQGKKCMDKMAYAEAIDCFLKGFDQHNDSAAIASSLAYCYWKVRDYSNASKWYGYADKQNLIQGEQYAYYARALRASGQYDAADDMLKKGNIQSQSRDPYAKYSGMDLVSIPDMLAQESYKVKKSTISTLGTEFSPVSNGGKLYFVGSDEHTMIKRRSSWNNKAFLNIYQVNEAAFYESGSAHPLKGDVNSKVHEGPFCFSPDNTQFYFTQNGESSGNKSDTPNNLEIFIASLQEDKWTNPQAFKYNSSEYSVGHPTISEDGNTLIFCSNMPGGFGGVDLYKCTKMPDGTWGPPENMGEYINTYGDEMFPTINQNRWLFFASDGHYSLGGLDIIRADMEDDEAQLAYFPEPVNSVADDFGIFLDATGSAGYFSSNRDGSDDIFEFLASVSILEPLEERKVHFATVIRDNELNIPIANVSVEFHEKNSGDVVYAETDNEGIVKADLNLEGDYEMKMKKDGYFFESQELQLLDWIEEAGGGMEVVEIFDFGLEKLEINKTVRIENIYYEYNASSLTEEARIELDNIITMMEDNPSLVIELGSHTDSRGEERYNLSLSQKRAKSAVDYLFSRGVTSDRLTWRGYGESSPIEPCYDADRCPESIHSVNRRTEFKVLYY